MVIPKPLCQCEICREARRKGPPYERTGPSMFIYDANLLIDTPAEIALQLNRADIDRIEYLIFTHLDPDHIEGFRVVEQITIDYRTWEAYPEKQICLILPKILMDRLQDVRSAYGSQVKYFESQGYIKCISFEDKIEINSVKVHAIPVDRGDQISFIYVFEKSGRRMIYAPCDIKPFPEEREELFRPNLLVIQPGIFEEGLKHRFHYPEKHISRTTLYTIDETLALSRRMEAEQVLFIHLEEYWNRSHTDYFAMQYDYDNVQFSYDGMRVKV